MGRVDQSHLQMVFQYIQKVRKNLTSYSIRAINCSFFDRLELEILLTGQKRLTETLPVFGANDLDLF